MLARLCREGTCSHRSASAMVLGGVAGVNGDVLGLFAPLAEPAADLAPDILGLVLRLLHLLVLLGVLQCISLICFIALGKYLVMELLFLFPFLPSNLFVVLRQHTVLSKGASQG